MIGCVLTYQRMQQSDRRQFNLYHTYLCVPFAIHFFMLGAWFATSLCVVGGIRTLLLSTSWGWSRRKTVVSICLLIPLSGSIYTASHIADWILLVTTVFGVGAEVLKSFLGLRIATLVNNIAWGINGLVFGAYVNAFGQLCGVIGNLTAMEKQHRFLTRYCPQQLSATQGVECCVSTAASSQIPRFLKKC